MYFVASSSLAFLSPSATGPFLRYPSSSSFTDSLSSERGPSAGDLVSVSLCPGSGTGI